jgi:hypothetical protein
MKKLIDFILKKIFGQNSWIQIRELVPQIAVLTAFGQI